MSDLYDFLWKVSGCVIHEHNKDFTPVIFMYRERLQAEPFSCQHVAEGIASLRFVYLLNPVQILKASDVTIERVAKELNDISESVVLQTDPKNPDVSQEALYDEMMEMFCRALVGKDIKTIWRDEILKVADLQKAELAKQNELIAVVKEFKQRFDRVQPMLEAFRFLISHSDVFIRLGQWVEQVPSQKRRKSLASALYLLGQENRELSQEELSAIQKVVESETEAN